MSSKIVLFILAAVLATALGLPAIVEQETPLARMVRAASPDPQHPAQYGGYGGGFGGGFGGAYPHGGLGGSFSESVAKAGSFNSPQGSSSFATAQAGSGTHGR